MRGTLGVAEHRITAKKIGKYRKTVKKKNRKIPQFHSKPVLLVDLLT